MLLFLIGPSASGKSTQADLLAQKFTLEHLAVGQMFRDQIAKGTELGHAIEEDYRAGRFVPDHFATSIVADSLKDTLTNFDGCVIDGYPRTFNQAEQIQPVIESKHLYYKVIHYLLSKEECIKRQQYRIEHQGARIDDEKLEERISAYLKDIEQIASFYRDRNVLFEIEANQSVEEIFSKTVEVIEADMLPA
jgi:adenylate kinase